MKILADAEGPYGKWQRIDWKPDGPHGEATIGCYVLRLPHAHPFWHHYMLFGIHLRPIEGVEDAELHFEGATHQVNVHALDPNFDPGPPWHYLTPGNVEFQLNTTDEEVVKLLELFADATINIDFPVESGGRSLSNFWQQTALTSLDHERGHPIAKAKLN